jgi:integrase
MALTDLRCRSVRPSAKLQKLSDGGGLQLWVQPTGTRWWRLAYRYQGKQKLPALGVHPTVSLADARQAREGAKRLLAGDVDPSQQRRDKKDEDCGGLFRAIGDEYGARLEKEGRTEKTISKTKWLLSFAYQEFGGCSIKKIDPPAVLKVLRHVEARGRYETARRLRSTLGSVFRYAIATARAQVDPTIVLRDALIAPKVKFRAAITEPKSLGALLCAIDTFEGQPETHAALRLLPLLFPRPGELRLAEWPEFDSATSIWTIPGGRMKMRRPHRVPLATQTIAILEQLRRINGSGRLLFPGTRSTERAISDVTLNAALRRLGYTKDEVTAHGFRATASTLLNESGKWHPDAIVRQLAHIENDDVRRAYARGEHWDECVRMMQWWADYLDNLKGRTDSAASGTASARSARADFLDENCEEVLPAVCAKRALKPQQVWAIRSGSTANAGYATARCSILL